MSGDYNATTPLNWDISLVLPCLVLFATDGLPRGFCLPRCHHLYYNDVSKHPLKLDRFGRWTWFISCYIKFWHVLFWKDFGYYSCKPFIIYIIHWVSKLTLSIYICRWWARRRWRLDVIRELVLDFCYVGLTCNYVGSLENHASRLVIFVFRTRRLEKPFDQDVCFVCMLCRQRGCRQSGRLCSLTCSSCILFMSACEALC